MEVEAADLRRHWFRLDIDRELHSKHRFLHNPLVNNLQVVSHKKLESDYHDILREHTGSYTDLVPDPCHSHNCVFHRHSSHFAAYSLEDSSISYTSPVVCIQVDTMVRVKDLDIQLVDGYLVLASPI